jgi:hypothetical protein
VRVCLVKVQFLHLRKHLVPGCAIVRLVKDLKENPEHWENDTLERFLDAIAAWVEDMDGYYQNLNKPIPVVEWDIFGQILLAARIYE